MLDGKIPSGPMKDKWTLHKNNIKLVSFSKIPYPLTFKGMMDRLGHTIYKHPSFSGLYAFSKKAWEETEDIEDLKKIPRGEDTHLHADLTKKYSALFLSGLRINILTTCIIGSINFVQKTLMLLGIFQKE